MCPPFPKQPGQSRHASHPAVRDGRAVSLARSLRGVPKPVLGPAVTVPTVPGRCGGRAAICRAEGGSQRQSAQREKRLRGAPCGGGLGWDMGPSARGAEYYAASLHQTRQGPVAQPRCPGWAPKSSLEWPQVGQASVPSENFPKGFQSVVTFENPWLLSGQRVTGRPRWPPDAPFPSPALRLWARTLSW